MKMNKSFLVGFVAVLFTVFYSGFSIAQVSPPTNLEPPKTVQPPKNTEPPPFWKGDEYKKICTKNYISGKYECPQFARDFRKQCVKDGKTAWQLNIVPLDLNTIDRKCTKMKYVEEYKGNYPYIDFNEKGCEKYLPLKECQDSLGGFGMAGHSTSVVLVGKGTNNPNFDKYCVIEPQNLKEKYCWEVDPATCSPDDEELREEDINGIMFAYYPKCRYAHTWHYDWKETPDDEVNK